MANRANFIIENPAPDFLDGNLAVLSLRTAQEIDRRLKGRKSDSSVLTQFGSVISKASGIGVAPRTTFLQGDPSTAELFSQAVEEAANEPVEDVESLTNRIREIIVPLVEKQGNWSNQELRLVKAFCLAFHKALVTQWLPPSHEQEMPFEDELRFIR